MFSVFFFPLCSINTPIAEPQSFFFLSLLLYFTFDTSLIILARHFFLIQQLPYGASAPLLTAFENDARVRVCTRAHVCALSVGGGTWQEAVRGRGMILLVFGLEQRTRLKSLEILSSRLGLDSFGV